MLTSLCSLLRPRAETPAPLVAPAVRSLDEQILWTDLLAIEAVGQLFHAINTMSRTPLVLDPHGPPARHNKLASGEVETGIYTDVRLDELYCEFRMTDLAACVYAHDRLSLIRNYLNSPLVSLCQAIRAVVHPHLERPGTVALVTRPYDELPGDSADRAQMHTSHVLRQQLHLSVTSRREPDAPYVTFRLRFLFGVGRLQAVREGSD